MSSIGTAGVEAHANPPSSSSNVPPLTGESPNTDNKREGSSGTGFFISKDGYIVTNAHVAGSCASIKVNPDGGTLVGARLVSRDQTNDLVILKADSIRTKFAHFRAGLRLGESAAAFGFPLNTILASSGNFTIGNVTALVGLSDDSRFIQMSTPVRPGNSGGPLLDQYGNLAGVVTSKLDAMKVIAAIGDIPQNVNFAIKSSVVASFFEGNNIAYDSGSRNSAWGTADLAEYAKAISVLVTCQN
jgi:serine protease Do